MLIQPQTTKQMSGCSLGLCIWLSFLRLALPGWPGQSLQTFPYDTCNSLASNFLAPAGAQKPGGGGGGRGGTRGGTGAGGCWQEPGPVANPQKASLCVSSHVAAASSIATPQGSENSSLSIYFTKCCPWCSNHLRAQSMPFKTIKRHKTELVTASSSLKSAIKCQFEEPWLALCRSPAGLCPWEGRECFSSSLRRSCLLTKPGCSHHLPSDFPL